MMERLVEPRTTIGVIQKYNFAFRKRFGQNFLIDGRVLDKIIKASGVTKEDFVLEIGPGIGTLTQALSEAAAAVAAVEIDRDLVDILHETLADCPNVTIVPGDIMKTDIPSLVNELGGGRPLRVVANLPYYITTPVLMELFECGADPVQVTVMVQKEVASRILAEPGTENYGAITLAIRYYAEPELAANVPPNCFMPRPTVGSAVLNLRCFGGAKPVRPKDEKLMFALIKAAFGQRRKTLVNSLEHGTSFGLGKEDIRSAIVRLGIPENTRGEELSLAQFAELSDIIHSHMETITIGQSGTD
jgi:16S rRNA (adenine1518-N6/adenine1519-N6)-dimethyltransferase